MNRLQRWWRRRLLRKQHIPLHTWEAAVSRCAVLNALNAEECLRLRELASRFLHAKSINGAQGLLVSAQMRAEIAAQACLLILNLDLDYFSGWREVIVYPDTFIAEHEEHDEAGVVHRVRRVQGGEAWERGPVILSWQDARPGAQPHGPGSNVILHEFAHKLDMLSGAANGMPSLHADMSRPAWTEALTAAYDDLRRQVDHHHHTAIDPYATESPAEFFAVLTENFFESPWLVHETYPRIYDLFKQFYRQDPLNRMERAKR